jgi:hypothetical protein
LISADSAFERVSNAAAAAFAKQPPYIVYRVDVTTTGRALPSLERHLVTLRTADDAALVRDTQDAQAKPGEALPLEPTVDALAEWGFRFETSHGRTRLSVAYQRPKEYAAPRAAPGDTVVVASVAGYAISYAPDAANHLHLEPATAAKRAFAAQEDHFVYRDVWFDPATFLPTRVVVAATDETLTLDYTVAESHWVLAGFTYDGRLDSQRADPAEREHVEASYSDYSFPPSVAGF